MELGHTAHDGRSKARQNKCSDFMNIEDVRQYCLSLPMVTEGFPFDTETLVFKVGSRMIGYIPLERALGYICLKCDPDRSEDLRARYDGIEPAWHMNKRHWIGITLDHGVPKALIQELIRHSYEIVCNKLPRREREALGLSSANKQDSL